MRDERDVTDPEAVLPAGWTWTTIGDVADVNPSGRTVSPSDSTPVSFLPMAAVEELTGRVDATQHRPFGEVKKGFTRFQEGDLLFAKITPSMENGKIAVARGLANGLGCGTTEFHVLRPTASLDVDYLRYFVVRGCFRSEAKRKMAGAVGQQRVPKSFLEEHRIPLPPLSEQQRIVSRIEELFSKIEGGERAILDARIALKHYRRSVLQAAVTGELTADWRTARGRPADFGTALLSHILDARRDAWECAELEKHRSRHKPLPKSEAQWAKFRARYDEPTEPDDENDLGAPDGWSIASVEQVTSAVRPVAYGVLQPGEQLTGGTRLVRVCDVHDGRVLLDEIKEIDPSIASEFQRTFSRAARSS